MIHHQNADAMVLASARLRGIPPWTSAILNGDECLSNAHWLGPWRQHLMTNYGLRQNHRKIIGKTKKSAFCVPYSVVLPWQLFRYFMFGKYNGFISKARVSALFSSILINSDPIKVQIINRSSYIIGLIANSVLS
jgi:hypothetical protein